MTKHRINDVDLSFPDDRKELIAAACGIEETCVSVGGLAHTFGILDTPQPPTQTLGARVFPKFLELWRREHQLSAGDLAARATLTEAEVLEAEIGLTAPEPRILYLLSPVLGVSFDKLMRLTGLIHERDEALSSAAVRFAARSEPMQVLTPAEQAAFHDFINALAL